MSKLTVTDYYVPLVAETYASSKVVLELALDHVVFYVAETTRELRVRAYGSNQTLVLMQGVEWCHGFVEDGLAYLYIALSTGGIRLLTYRNFGETPAALVGVALGYNAVYLHTIREGGHYLMVIDAGAKLYLLTADDPTFTQRFQAIQIYSNLRDTVYRISRPVMGVHPEDLQLRPAVSRITFAVDREILATKARDIGLFVKEVVL